MAVPSYTTDLTTLAIGSITVDVGAWDESTDAGWDTGGAMVDDGNLYYNGTKCVSAQMTKDSNGTGASGPATIMYEHTSTVTVPTDGAILIHHMWAAPPALNTIANGGVKILVGNSTTSFGVFFAWNISGSDFLPAPKGGWANYAINPAIGSPDDTVGSPATPYDTFGMAVGATQQARGNPNAVNAVRYGRCESIFQDGDIANGYCTFAGYGDVDSTSTNKWSLIDPVEGGYKYQGLMSLGSTGTSADFRDENVNITIANTINVTSGFNKIEVNNISTNIEWTAVNISTLGTVSKGAFEVVDDAVIKKTDCVFTDMNTFIYQSNSELTNTTYRRCGQITQGSATFDGCAFDNTTAVTAITCDNVTNLDACKFASDGSSHAITITSTGTYDLTNHIFVDYATIDGTTGNEVIYNNSGGAVTLNASGNTGTLSVRNGAGATTTLVINPVTTAITVRDLSTGLIIESARVLVWVTDNANYFYQATVSITGSSTTATVTHTAHGLATGDNVIIEGVENDDDYNGVYIVTVVDVDTYTYTAPDVLNLSPATGTITSTMALISEGTNASGIANDTRSLSANQAIGGRIRKSTTSPYYKQGVISGTVSSTNGFSATVQLVGDE